MCIFKTEAFIISYLAFRAFKGYERQKILWPYRGSILLICWDTNGEKVSDFSLSISSDETTIPPDVSTLASVTVHEDGSHKCARMYVKVPVTPLWVDTQSQPSRVDSNPTALDWLAHPAPWQLATLSVLGVILIPVPLPECWLLPFSTVLSESRGINSALFRSSSLSTECNFPYLREVIEILLIIHV